GNETDPVAHSGVGHILLTTSEHACSQIHTDDVGRGTRRELERDARGARRNVQYPGWRRVHDVVDHCTPPPSVLAHGEDLSQLVVLLREGREQLLREAIPISGNFRW